MKSAAASSGKNGGRSGSQPTVAEVVARLRAQADAKNVEGMARFGITGENRLGIKVPVLRQMAKEIGKDHTLALALWKTKIPEARILASMVGDTKLLTEKQMDRWVRDFDTWDVCDQTCQNLFDKHPAAWDKVTEWAGWQGEFERRAAFALLAVLAWHDKKATDAQFAPYFPVLVAAANDERNYVKKAVSWALRNIGKRNAALRRTAIQCARDMQREDSHTARWVAADVLKELGKVKS